MCGIAGFVLKYYSAPADLLIKKLVDSLSHRGPDGTGHIYRDNSCIINTRLSIIDLQGGAQPFASENNQIFVVQNGEIYNYIELREELKNKGHLFHTASDTEVILRAYEEYGPDFVRHFNGMFAIAVLDYAKGKLLLYRDRIGVKPLFLYHGHQGIYFSSEIKTFLTLPEFSRTIDLQSLYLYLVYNYVPLPYTIFKNVTHVSPGTQVSIDLKSGASSHSTYWKIPNEPEMKTDCQESLIIDKLDALFQSSISLRLRSDVPIGIFLSSGLDSNLVAYGINKNSSQSHEAFSIQTAELAFDESEDAAKTARSLGWGHQKILIKPEDINTWSQTLWYADQPHGDISFIALKKLSHMAAKQLKVVFTGDGGDELFAGYDKYRSFQQAIPSNDLLKRYFSSENIAEEESLLQSICTGHFLSQTPRQGAYNLFLDTISHVSNKDSLNQLLYFDLCQLLPANNLVKTDRMAMSHGLEPRSPLLDYRLFDYLMTLPSKEKVKNNESRYLQRRLAERYVPKEVISRKKKMLSVPVGEWFKTELQHFLVNFFDHVIQWERGYFEPASIKKMVSEHISGKKDHRRVLRAIIAFELWISTMEQHS